MKNNSRADVVRAGGSSGKPGKQMYPARCVKCGKACEVPFQATAERPAYCRECFLIKRAMMDQANPTRPAAHARPMPQGQTSNHAALNGVISKVDALNAKIDRVIQMLEAHTAAKTEVEQKKKPAAKKTVKSPAAKKKAAAKK